MEEGKVIACSFTAQLDVVYIKRNILSIWLDDSNVTGKNKGSTIVPKSCSPEPPFPKGYFLKVYKGNIFFLCYSSFQIASWRSCGTSTHSRVCFILLLVCATIQWTFKLYWCFTITDQLVVMFPEMSILHFYKYMQDKFLIVQLL